MGLVEWSQSGVGTPEKAPKEENYCLCVPMATGAEGGNSSWLGVPGVPQTGQAGVGMAEMLGSCEATRKRIWTLFRNQRKRSW